MKIRESGFTLISVMILTSMVGLVVLNSLRDNFIQERLTGNYQKKLNARLVSEKGIFDTYKKVLDELKNKPKSTLQQLINNTLGENDAITGAASQDMTSMTYATRLNTNRDGYLELSSDGKRFEGANNTVALFELISGGSGSTFSTGIIGCEGVSVGSGGRIDSYDSNNGAYTDSLATNESGVTTIHQDADVTLNGGGTLWGSINATGHIDVSAGTTVYGDVHSNKSITINSGPRRSSQDIPAGFSKEITVGGDVLAVGDVNFQQNEIWGVIRTEANLTIGIGGHTYVRNTDSNGFDVMYGGTLNSGSGTVSLHHQQDGIPYTDPRYNSMPNVPSVPEVDPNNLPADHDSSDPEKNCDPIGISSVIGDYADAAALDLTMLHGNTLYEITPVKGEDETVWENWMGDKPALQYPTTEILPTGESVPMYKFKNVNINGGGVKISGGDVFVMVDGDFTIGTSGSTVFEIEPGSSLTLYVTGKVMIKQPLTLREGLSDTDRPAFAIYSSYAGADGVVIDATGTIYAAIYSPHTNANISASGGLMGALRAKTVDVTGSGGIHYDVRLGDIGNVSGSGGTTRLVFKGWRYK